MLSSSTYGHSHHSHIHPHHHHTIPQANQLTTAPTNYNMLLQDSSITTQQWTYPSTQHISQPPLPTHICHWQNCHRTFHSMPDLLGHVAADHLGAPGFTAPPPTPIAPPISTFSTPSIDLITSGNISTQPLPINPVYTPTEADHLLSCLWDDCFPLPECTAPIPESCPTHSHMPAHPITSHSQNLSQTHTQSVSVDSNIGPHTHLTGSGEPFSPQTMLRHVLEEHLGVPGEIIGWGEHDPPPILPPTSNDHVIQAHTKLHNDHHIHNHQHTHGHGHHHHHHHPHPHNLPTPSPSIPSIPPSPATRGVFSPNSQSKQGVFPTKCLWVNCIDGQTEYTSKELMNHLTTIHVPLRSTIKPPNSNFNSHTNLDPEAESSEESNLKSNPAEQINPHTCLWDGCNRPFTSRQKLVRHLQSHIGYKPFLCHICGVGFGEAVPLAAHLRRHAKESELLNLPLLISLSCLLPTVQSTNPLSDSLYLCR